MQNSALKVFPGNIFQVISNDREKQILDLISRGLSSDEIATKLFVSYETVRSPRKSLLQKFRARNMAQLARRSIELEQLMI